MKKTTIKRLTAYCSQIKEVRNKVAELTLDDKLTDEEAETLESVYDLLNEACGTLACMLDKTNH